MAHNFTVFDMSSYSAGPITSYRKIYGDDVWFQQLQSCTIKFPNLGFHFVLSSFCCDSQNIGTFLYEFDV
jgi:hypothetical protein